jgi:hypothetical protein
LNGRRQAPSGIALGYVGDRYFRFRVYFLLGDMEVVLAVYTMTMSVVLLWLRLSFHSGYRWLARWLYRLVQSSSLHS